MATARNGDVELYYESFGDPSNPTLLLVNGLGSQCINYAEEWCERFVAAGHRVIRFDNRDVGLSSHLPGVEYSLQDMANDAVAVLDAAGVDKAHILGLSMGGMIVQRIAIDHRDRVLTMTSVMSRTGEPGFGDSAPEAFAALTRKPPQSRDEAIANQLESLGIFGSKPEWIDVEEAKARAGAAYDRCFDPAGVGRQMQAVGRDGSRDAALSTIDVPTLVMHGSRDTLIKPDGGRHTADVIPGAQYVEIEGMGHDYPRAVWDLWIETWTTFVAGANVE
jgi:pimeloyl-ACP methyl ester carboxylesterase